MSWLRAIFRVASANRLAANVFALSSAFFALSVVAVFSAQWSNSLVLTLNSFTLAQHCLLILSTIASDIAHQRLLMNAANMSSSAGCHHDHSHDHDHSHHHHDPSVEASLEVKKSFISPASQTNDLFPFGLQRVDVLVQYAAHVAMLFAAGKTLVECAQRALEAHDTHPVLVELVSLLHCALVCVSASLTESEKLALVVRRRGSGGAGKRSAMSRTITFYARRCVSPLTCLASCQLVAATGICRLDILFATLLACWIGFESYRQICFLGGILVNRSPDPANSNNHDRKVAAEEGFFVDTCVKSVAHKARREMQLVPGVLAVDVFRVWTLVPGFDAVSARVRISNEVDEQAVLRSLRLMLEAVAAFVTVQCQRSSSGSVAGASPPPAPSCGSLALDAADQGSPRMMLGRGIQILPPAPSNSIGSTFLNFASSTASVGDQPLQFPAPPQLRPLVIGNNEQA